MDQSVDRQFANHLNDSLLWLPEHGMGHYPVRADDWPYDADYFEKYRGYAATPLGERITRFRVDLVNRYTRGPVVDVGIGCGHFIETRGPGTLGYDINPAGVAWLQDRGLYCDVYAAERIEAVTLWDVLEHLPRPQHLLDRVGRFVFASLPIFRDADHVTQSKHYRRDEHYWYFTPEGVVKWMAGYGFDLLERSDAETQLGREDIATFVLERRR